jgi:hypothetical protein
MCSFQRLIDVCMFCIFQVVGSLRVFIRCCNGCSCCLQVALAANQEAQAIARNGEQRRLEFFTYIAKVILLQQLDTFLSQSTFQALSAGFSSTHPGPIQARAATSKQRLVNTTVDVSWVPFDEMITGQISTSTSGMLKWPVHQTKGLILYHFHSIQQ